MNTSLLSLVAAALLGASVTLFAGWWPRIAAGDDVAGGWRLGLVIVVMGAIGPFTAIFDSRERRGQLSMAAGYAGLSSLVVLASESFSDFDGSAHLPVSFLTIFAGFALVSLVIHRGRSGLGPWHALWGAVAACALGATSGAFFLPDVCASPMEPRVGIAVVMAAAAVVCAVLAPFASERPDPPAGQGGVGGTALIGALLAGALLAFGAGAGTPSALAEFVEPDGTVLTASRMLAWRLALVTALATAAALVAGWREGPVGAGSSSWRGRSWGAALLLLLVGAGAAILVMDQQSGSPSEAPGKLWEQESGPRAQALAHRMGRLSAALAPGAEDILLLRADETRADIDVALGEGLRSVGHDSIGDRGTADARELSLGILDLIVCAPVTPWKQGAGARLSLEHFERLRRGLTDEGLAIVWLPLDRMPWTVLQAVILSFLEAFPESRAFVATPLSDQPMLALVGGRARLPAAEDIDAMLVGRPDPFGPADAASVYGLAVADAWVLRQRMDGVDPATRTPLRVELASLSARGREGLVAAANLRLLAAMVQALDPSALERGPIDGREQRELAQEFGARAESLASLLRARAARLELLVTADDPVQDPDLWRNSHEREGLDDDLDGGLLAAWTATPGHADVRAAILERAAQLQGRDEAGRMASLLEAALAHHGDVALATPYGGVLLMLGHDDTAVGILEWAQAVTPGNRAVLVHLGSAYARVGRDDEARETLHAARRAFGPDTFPPMPTLVLGLLEGDETARTYARSLIAQPDAGEAWTPTLKRLLGVVDDS